MRTRAYLGFVILLLLLQVFCAPSHRSPNILLLYVDDMGWTGLSCYGNPHVETAYIDGLAEEGLRFTQAYAAPMCSPSRAALLSGQYPARLHITRALPGRDDTERAAWKKLQTPMPRPGLPFSQHTLAESLKEWGYTTALLGKWHLGTEDGGSGYWIKEPHDLENIRKFFGFDVVDPGQDLEKDKGVTYLTNQAVSFIEQNRSRPFFVFLSHHSVHTFCAAPQPLVDKYLAQGYPATGPYPYEGIDSATYLAMIEHLDRETGRLLDCLDKLDLANQTVVMFVSDNGGSTRVTRNTPLRRGKGTCYEGGIRVPWIVRWPGRVAAGETCDVPVHTVDIYPTLLEIAGGTPPDGQIWDGESLAPLLQGGTPPRRENLFFHIPHYLCYPLGHFRTTPHGAVRQGDFKLVEFFGDYFAFPSAANQDSPMYDPNLAEYIPQRKVELFNLKEDPGESHDLSLEMPDKTAELLKLLQEWRRSLDADMPILNPSYDPRESFVSEFDSTRVVKK